jgi:hypothetical protein
MTVERERVADGKEKVEVVQDKGRANDDRREDHGQTEDGVAVGDNREGRYDAKGKAGDLSRSRSRRRTVTDQNQTGSVDDLEDRLMPGPHGKEVDGNQLSPDTGVTGKRPRVDGIAMPFTLKKEAETASMITLNSGRVDGTQK